MPRAAATPLKPLSEVASAITDRIGDGGTVSGVAVRMASAFEVLARTVYLPLR